MKDDKDLSNANKDEATSEIEVSNESSTPTEQAVATSTSVEPETTTDEPPTTDAGDSSSTTVNEESSTAPPPEANKKKKPWLAIIALIVAVIAIAAVAYLYLQLQQVKAETASTSELATGLVTSVDSTRSLGQEQANKTNTLASDLNTLKSKVTSQQNNVDELQERLTQSVKQISKLGSNTRKDWLLAETEYLLRLANQRILLENSPVGASALLRSADEILRETDDVSLYNVRKAIAVDIAALEAVPKLDIDGTFLKLAALNTRVSQLSLLPVSESPELPKMLKEVDEEALTDSWQQGLAESFKTAMSKLSSLIIIQHRDDAIEPLLTHEQGYYIQQNLNLMIEQAQLALLQGHQQSYDASLNKATNWIARYFKEKDSNTQALLKGLNELKPIQVAPPLPDISGSLRALKQYFADIQTREQ